MIFQPAPQNQNTPPSLSRPDGADERVQSAESLASAEPGRAETARGEFPVGWQGRSDALHETLGRLRGRRILVLLNRGNRGDGVIHLGGRRLLESLELEWEEIHETKAPPRIAAEVLLVFGCGAFCRGTHSMIEPVTRYASQVEQVIILPASFDLSCGRVRAFAETWDEKFTVFCRERRSFEALTRARVGAGRLLLSHDLAFCADVKAWSERPHGGVAGIFRRDREAVFDRRPHELPGKDISQGPDSEPQALLDYVARFAVVHTDRTHAAITAAMMGREVWFYRNAYFKNEAIYEHSLAHLPQVHFVGEQPFSFRQFATALYGRHVQRNVFRVRRRWRTMKDWRMGSAASRSGGSARPLATGDAAGSAEEPRALAGSAIGERMTNAEPRRPALSVIMPAYNAGRFLVPAIESVLSQSWRDFEFIIIDDGSTDGTREKIEAYAAKDARIRSCPNPQNLGVVRTLNRAISLVRADWIARMDADDLSLPNRFARQMEVVRADPTLGFVTCPFDVIDAQDRRRPGWRGICFQQELLPFFLLFYNRLNAHGQVLYSARLVRELGGYREAYHLSEATEMWIRMVRRATWAVVPEPLYAWRAANPNSVTKQNTFRYAEGSLRACREEIGRACGIELTREQMIALRDFWLRIDEKTRDWSEVDRLIAKVARDYRPPKPVDGWTRHLAIAIACAWLGHAALQVKHRHFQQAAGHMSRAARAAGPWLPMAAAQFARETVAVRGHLSRRA